MPTIIIFIGCAARTELHCINAIIKSTSIFFFFCCCCCCCCCSPPTLGQRSIISSSNDDNMATPDDVMSADSRYDGRFATPSVVGCYFGRGEEDEDERISEVAGGGRGGASGSGGARDGGKVSKSEEGPNPLRRPPSQHPPSPCVPYRQLPLCRVRGGQS